MKGQNDGQNFGQIFGQNNFRRLHEQRQGFTTETADAVQSPAV
jgi:hypothetical protein